MSTSLRGLPWPPLQPAKLAITFKGHTIADILDIAVEDAEPILKDIPTVNQKLHTLVTSASATSISASRYHPLRRRSPAHRSRPRALQEPTGRTPDLLDEPTTGLHFADVRGSSRSSNSLATPATPSSSSSTTWTSSKRRLGPRPRPRRRRRRRTHHRPRHT